MIILASVVTLLAVLATVGYIYRRPIMKRVKAWGWVDFMSKHPVVPMGDAYGIDVSYYQERIKWDKVHLCYDMVTRRMARPSKTTVQREFDFAIAKATEGVTITDRQYARNRDGIREAGILFGAYHFFSTTSNPERQANYFIRVSGLKPGDLRPVLDVEQLNRLTPRKLRTNVLAWLRRVEEHYGCKPIIYTSAKFREDYLSTPEFDDYIFWLAHYGVDTPRGECALWQFTDVGIVPGITEKVDINVLMQGSLDELIME